MRVKAIYIGISFRLTLTNVIDLSSSVSFLSPALKTFAFEKTSEPLPLVGNKITKAAIQTKHPPNHATIALHRWIDLVKKSFSKIVKPVVVNALTISRYESIILVSGKIIQFGIAKNKGNNRKDKIRDKSCENPVSFKSLLEVAKITNEKTSKLEGKRVNTIFII